MFVAAKNETLFGLDHPLRSSVVEVMMVGKTLSDSTTRVMNIA